MLKLFLIAAGLVLILDTLLILTVSNMNLGVVMPASIGLPLLTVGLLYEPAVIWFESGFGEIVKWLLILGYSFFLLTFAAALVLIKSASGQKPFKEADAVIVLGAGLRRSRVSYTLAKRLEAAAGYARTCPGTPIVVTGAKGPGEQITEASAMERYLLSKGIDQERIIKEEKATSTSENFRYSKKILDSILKRPYRVVFVTTDFHLFRAGLTAKKEGLNGYGIGSETKPYLLPNIYLREYIAVWQYLLTRKISLR